MIEKIIIAHLYNPGSAATNRILAYANGYKQLGLSVSLVLGCEGDVKVPNLSGIEVVEVKSQTHRGLSKKMADAIKAQYDPKRMVIQIYGTPELCLYLPKKHYSIFYECTEVPFYGEKASLPSRLKEVLRLWLTKRSTGMMVISKALRDYYSERGIKNIEIVNMFVDAERFKLDDAKSKEDYIAYCGKVSLHKDGVDTLIRAFSVFRENYPSVKLWIIGGFESNDTEAQVRGLSNELNLDNGVRFLGAVVPSDMPALLCGAKILALARPNNIQAKYGFPTKLGEYLATGKPVVVTKVGEIGDFLEDGVNCRIAEPDNCQDFAEKLSWVMDNYEQALQIGAKGRELTLSSFSSIEQCKVALSFMNRCIC